MAIIKSSTKVDVEYRVNDTTICIRFIDGVAREDGTIAVTSDGRTSVLRVSDARALCELINTGILDGNNPPLNLGWLHTDGH